MAGLFPTTFLDEFSERFKDFVAVEQLAAGGLRGAAFQLIFQLLKRPL
jgi:hypothetical protein